MGSGRRVTVQHDSSFRCPIDPSKANCLSSLVHDDQSCEIRPRSSQIFTGFTACCWHAVASSESELLLRSFPLADA